MSHPFPFHKQQMTSSGFMNKTKDHDQRDI